jgi:hypothetical protein
MAKSTFDRKLFLVKAAAGPARHQCPLERNRFQRRRLKLREVDSRKPSASSTASFYEWNPKYPSTKRTMTIAPTHQMMLFMVCSLSVEGESRYFRASRCSHEVGNTRSSDRDLEIRQSAVADANFSEGSDATSSLMVRS